MGSSSHTAGQVQGPVAWESPAPSGPRMLLLHDSPAVRAATLSASSESGHTIQTHPLFPGAGPWQMLRPVHGRLIPSLSGLLLSKKMVSGGGWAGWGKICGLQEKAMAPSLLFILFPFRKILISAPLLHTFARRHNGKFRELLKVTI